MIVSVRQRVTVYVDVDTDAGIVTRVFVDDESARLDTDEEVVDFEVLPMTSAAVAAEVVDAQPMAGEITPEIARRAVEIAESAEWPRWQVGA